METRRNFQISDLDTTDGGRPLASSARLLPPLSNAPMHPERSARRPSQGSLAATLTLLLVVLALLALIAR